MTEKLAAVTAKFEAQGRITDIDCKEYLLENSQDPRATTNNLGMDNNKVSGMLWHRFIRLFAKLLISFFSVSISILKSLI